MCDGGLVLLPCRLTKPSSLRFCWLLFLYYVPFAGYYMHLHVNGELRNSLFDFDSSSFVFVSLVLLCLYLPSSSLSLSHSSLFFFFFCFCFCFCLLLLYVLREGGRRLLSHTSAYSHSHCKSKSGVGVVRCVCCILHAALATRSMVHVEYGCQFQFYEIETATFPVVVVRLLFVFVLHDGGGFVLVLHNDY